MLLPDRTVQQFLKTEGVYTGEVDGKFGPLSRLAVTAYLKQQGILPPKAPRKATPWTSERERVAVEQLMFREAGSDVGTIDGFVGPQTRQAFEDYVKATRDESLPDAAVLHLPNVWPRQKDVSTFYGAMGQNQTMLVLPYPMKLAWDTNKIVKKISLHEKVAPSAERVLKRVKEIYGSSIPDLGLDLYGGSLNVRKMRGGNQWSMHSWGIAIDFDPEHNALNTPFKKARFGAPEYVPWWEAWELEGWVSLGRAAGYDAMHIQAARL